MGTKDDWMNVAMATMATLFLLLAASVFMENLHAYSVAAANVSETCELRTGGCKMLSGKSCPENGEPCKSVAGVYDCAK